jgi:3-hydroxymyristoyl/3-hydroxydecanoyl-(acyl carrier protein) dehydratase
MKPPEIETLSQPAAGEAVIEFSLPAIHPAFAGHFPDHPLLPGVVQLDWAMAFAARYLGVKDRAATDFQVKYRRVIPPEKRLRLELRVDREKGTLSFTYRCEGEIASSGRIKLAPVP